MYTSNSENLKNLGISRNSVLFFSLCAVAIATFRSNEDRKVVTAQSFVLADKNGSQRAVFSLGSGDKPTLTFFGTDSSLRLAIGLQEGDVPFVRLSDEKGKPRCSIVLFPKGEPVISLLDQQGTPRTKISLNSKGDPGFTFSDIKGTDRIAGGITEDQDPVITLRDESGKTHLGLILKDSETRVQLRNGLGKTLFQLEESATAAFMRFFSPSGELEYLIPPKSK